MNSFKNADGKKIVLAMVKAIQDNKAYLGDIDGLIGDGDHGMNMNKGFTICGNKLAEEDVSFTEALDELGTILLTEIGGSMGPIYGTIFMGMAEAAEDAEEIDAPLFAEMLDHALTELWDIVQAQVGDKTLVDTLSPARDAVKDAVAAGDDFKTALTKMKAAAEAGKESTIDLVAKFGRSSRLGERSRGVLDAGATSCNIILQAMADSMIEMLA